MYHNYIHLDFHTNINLFLHHKSNLHTSSSFYEQYHQMKLPSCLLWLEEKVALTISPFHSLSVSSTNIMIGIDLTSLYSSWRGVVTSWGHGCHTSIVLKPCLLCPMSPPLSNTSFELLVSAGFRQRLISRNNHIIIWNYQREMCSIGQARTSNSSVLHIPISLISTNVKNTFLPK